MRKGRRGKGSRQGGGRKGRMGRRVERKGTGGRVRGGGGRKKGRIGRRSEKESSLENIWTFPF